MEVAFLGPKIRHILTAPGVDLDTISAKRVRKQLIAAGEAEDFVRDRKPDIDALIAQIYESVKNGGGGVVEGWNGNGYGNGPAAPAFQATTNVHSSAQKRRRDPSPESQSYGGVPPSSQPQPLAHKKSKQINGSARGISDEELARQLSMELNGRSTRGGGSAAPSGSKAAKPKAGGKKAKRSKATINSDDDEEDDGRPKKTKGGLGKEYLLSEPLAYITGHSMLSRPQTVKKLWEHIKANNLQNPEDKREIMCDPSMKAVFHTERLNMFKMNKLLGQHLFEPGESTAA